MFLRNQSELSNQQNIVIECLIQEGVKGITKLDTLPNSSQPLHGEVEGMYFKALRDFFKNSISHEIMSFNQDIFEGK